MSTRERMLSTLGERLRDQRLVYFGTRGTDARPLSSLDAFGTVVGQIAPLDAFRVDEINLETSVGVRVDLNRYAIDQDRSPAVRRLRRALVHAFEKPAAVVPYRPCELLTSAWFPRSDRVRYLGVFHELQACFEHKPWVETSLRARGVPVVPWVYYGDDDLALVREACAGRPMVLRANRSDGGAGLCIVHDTDELASRLPEHYDRFLAAAPYLTPNIPLNINACVFPGGQVTLHGASLQLIGLPRCTGRRLGYCGNDFGRIKALDRRLVDALEDMTRRVGAWLEHNGYLGAFGIDALVHDDRLLLVEVNPRFQGSSALAAELDAEAGRPEQMLCHLAAFLGLPPPSGPSLAEQIDAQPTVAHIVCYNTADRPLARLPDGQAESGWELVPARSVEVEPEGILGELRVEAVVTDDGARLYRQVERRMVRGLRALYGPAAVSPMS